MRIHTFFIGGTGARIYRSLVHCFASGMYNDHLAKDIQFYTYLLDPDKYSDESIRASQTARNYQDIYSILKEDDEHPFWCTPILYNDNIGESLHSDISSSISFNTDLDHLKNTHLLLSALLGEHRGIGYNLMQMAKLTFSRLQLNDFFNEFIPKNDIVFIISGTFGFSGAAGIPELIQKIRGFNQSAKVVLVMMGPIFETKVSKSIGLHRSFYSRYQLINKYYSEVLKEELNPNCIYRIGLPPSSFVSNMVEYGELRQHYPAHILELWAASAIFDYLDFRHKSRELSFKMTGLNARQAITPNILSTEMRQRIDQLLCFSIWCRHFGKNDTAKGFLRDYADDFCHWLQEMKENFISFNPINFSCKSLSQSFYWYRPIRDAGLFRSTPLSSKALDKTSKRIYRSLTPHLPDNCRQIIAQSKACQEAWSQFKKLC